MRVCVCVSALSGALGWMSGGVAMASGVMSGGVAMAFDPNLPHLPCISLAAAKRTDEGHAHTHTHTHTHILALASLWVRNRTEGHKASNRRYENLKCKAATEGVSNNEAYGRG